MQPNVASLNAVCVYDTFLPIHRIMELQFMLVILVSNQEYASFSFKVKVYPLWFNFIFELVSATITVITVFCVFQVVNIERAAVSHFNVVGPDTTVCTPVKTDLPGYSAVCHLRMSTIYPTGSGRVTPAYRWTCSWHSGSSSSLETEPAATKCIVTLITHSDEGYLSVCIIQGLVVFTL